MYSAIVAAITSAATNADTSTREPDDDDRGADGRTAGTGRAATGGAVTGGAVTEGAVTEGAATGRVAEGRAATMGAGADGVENSRLRYESAREMSSWWETPVGVARVEPGLRPLPESES